MYYNQNDRLTPLFWHMSYEKNRRSFWWNTTRCLLHLRFSTSLNYSITRTLAPQYIANPDTLITIHKWKPAEVFPKTWIYKSNILLFSFTINLNTFTNISIYLQTFTKLYNIDKELCHRLSETPTILCIKHVKITEWVGIFGLIEHF